jgi:hypothetical protein
MEWQLRVREQHVAQREHRKGACAAHFLLWSPSQAPAPAATVESRRRRGRPYL